MKLLITAIVLAATSYAFAGPEEHFQSQSCYYLDTSREYLVSYNVPTQVCIETVNVNLDSETVVIYSYFMASLYEKAHLTKLTRKNEDFYRFEVASVVVNNSQERIQLLISGLANNYGEVSVSELSIQAKQDCTGGNCSAENQSRTFNYKLN